MVQNPRGEITWFNVWKPCRPYKARNRKVKGRSETITAFLDTVYGMNLYIQCIDHLHSYLQFPGWIWPAFFIFILNFITDMLRNFLQMNLTFFLLLLHNHAPAEFLQEIMRKDHGKRSELPLPGIPVFWYWRWLTVHLHEPAFVWIIIQSKQKGFLLLKDFKVFASLPGKILLRYDLPAMPKVCVTVGLLFPLEIGKLHTILWKRFVQSYNRTIIYFVTHHPTNVPCFFPGWMTLVAPGRYVPTIHYQFHISFGTAPSCLHSLRQYAVPCWISSPVPAAPIAGWPE